MIINNPGNAKIIFTVSSLRKRYPLSPVVRAMVTIVVEIFVNILNDSSRRETTDHVAIVSSTRSLSRPRRR